MSNRIPLRLWKTWQTAQRAVEIFGVLSVSFPATKAPFVVFL